MKWFKHESTESEGQLLAKIEQEFGLEGYARWFKLKEKIASQMDESGNCSASYPWEKWLTFLKGKRKKLETFLVSLENLQEISLERSGNILTISMPKLLNLKDNHSRNLQAKQKTLASKEVEKERYKQEKEKDCKPPAKKDSKKKKETDKTVVDFYHDLFLKKYGEKPMINGKDAKLLNEVQKKIGPERTEAILIRFFDTEDQFIINAGHTTGVFSSQVNRLICEGKIKKQEAPKTQKENDRQRRMDAIDKEMEERQ